MGSALVYVVVVGLVAGVIYLVAALVFGRGEELAPMAPGATPTRLPARDLTGADVRDLRFQQTLRGYKCGGVGWALSRLAAEVDALRARLDVVAAATPGGAGVEPDDATPTDPNLRARESRTPVPGMVTADTAERSRPR